MVILIFNYIYLSRIVKMFPISQFTKTVTASRMSICDEEVARIDCVFTRINRIDYIAVKIVTSLPSTAPKG